MGQLTINAKSQYRTVKKAPGLGQTWLYILGVLLSINIASKNFFKRGIMSLSKNCWNENIKQQL
jgi:hypothetical protein